MIINKAALNRQSTVMVLLVFIIIAGISSYASLPRESDPDITIPYIFVQTSFEGVAPEDMETLITMPIERKLKGLSGTKEISSISDDGVSIIKVEFNPDVDIDDACKRSATRLIRPNRTCRMTCPTNRSSTKSTSRNSPY